MAGMGSIAERQLLTENPGLLPVRFQVCAALPGMSDFGWFSEWRLEKLCQGAGTVIDPLLCRNIRDEFETAAKVVGDCIRIPVVCAQRN